MPNLKFPHKKPLKIKSIDMMKKNSRKRKYFYNRNMTSLTKRKKKNKKY